MKRLFLVCLLCIFSVPFALAPSTAQAMTLSKFHSYYGRVFQACADVGGVFSEDSGGYGCTHNNCDGKGNPQGGDAHTCTVGCTYGSSESGGDNCHGSTPRKLTGIVTVRMILQDGSTVIHHYGVDEGPSKDGSEALPASEDPPEPEDPAPVL